MHGLVSPDRSPRRVEFTKALLGLHSLFDLTCPHEWYHPPCGLGSWDSFIFFPMGLFYYSSANGADYNQRRPHSALAYRPPAPEATFPKSRALDPIPWSGIQMVSGLT